MKTIWKLTKNKRIKCLSAVMCLAIMLSVLQIGAFSAPINEDIVILYENDVHCAVEGYSKLAALKQDLWQTYEYVGVVSSGDYIQGGSISTISRGEYIVRLMNLVGYDAVALGNHEFDFKLERLNELAALMKTPPVCCNFEKIGEDEPYFKPYTIVAYGDVKIAYIGITTPSTVTSSSPAQFKDENGEMIFTFHATDLASAVQKHVDSARNEGADYVIALSHLGDREPSHNADELIPFISGIDVFLDAHSHSAYADRVFKDKNGEDVIVSSTGTKFEHIGKLTISNGYITTELISLESYENTDPEVDACLAEINDEYKALGDRNVAYSEIDLITHDENDNRIVRVGETNLGNLCSDAFRIMLNADIGYMNGGGIRAPIAKGDVTLNDLLDVYPFNNQSVMIETTGSAIRDMLELTTSSWPEEGGSFPHLSGMTFSLDTSIDSSVVLDENEVFVRVDGEYRVYDIKVMNRESGEYEPLDLEKKYTVAGTNHSLLEGGGGMSMLEDATVVTNNGDLDVDLLERYIAENFDGVIGSQYAQLSQHITFTDGKTSTEDNAETDGEDQTDNSGANAETNGEEKSDEGSSVMFAPWIIIVCAIVAGIAAVVVIVIVVVKKSAKK